MKPAPTAPDSTLPPARTALAQLRSYLQNDLLLCAIVAAIAFIARAPGLNGQHIWDDHYLALANPLMRSPLLLLETFRQYLFLDSFSSHYRPVQTVSYIFDYFFYGTDPYGFHVTNVLLHSACGVVLYLLLKQLFASLWFRSQSLAARARLQRRMPLISALAFFVALVWAVHPVHSAAIDYISGRADSLAFLLSASAWLLFILARKRQAIVPQTVLFALSAFLLVLGLCSRESAAIWLGIFLGHLFVLERNLGLRTRVLTLVACLLCLGAYGTLRQLPAPRHSPPPAEGWVAPMRATLMARSLGDYTRLMLLPRNLHMERSVLEPAAFADNTAWRASTKEYLSLAGLATIMVLLVGCRCGGVGRPARIFGAAWFIGAYLPISNLLSLNATVAEHWLYLPSVGFLIFLAGCAVELPRRHRRPVIAFAVLAVTALATRSMMRSSDWADEETFYSRTMEAGGSSVRVAANLAEVYSRKEDLVGAERMFRRILEIAPHHPMARNNLAKLLDHAGRKDEAEKLFAASAADAVETKKAYVGTWVATINFARLCWQQGDREHALAILRQAQLDYPGNWSVIRTQAEILRTGGADDAAIALVEQFATKYWWHHDAAMALGRLYAFSGDTLRAEESLWHASRLDVHDTQALNLLATVRMNAGRLGDAAAAQRKAVARQPHHPRQYLMLSDILEKMGRTEEANLLHAQVNRMQALAQANTTATPN